MNTHIISHIFCVRWRQNRQKLSNSNYIKFTFNFCNVLWTGLYTSYFLEARQPTQATTIENLKYETSCRNAKLLINHTECIEYSMYLMPHYHLEPLSTRMCPSFEHKYSCGSLLKKDRKIVWIISFSDNDLWTHSGRYSRFF